MRWAGDFVHDAVEYWPEWVWEAGDQIDAEAINQFRGPNLERAEPTGDEQTEAQDERRGRLITMMRWRLEPDQALVLEFDHSDAFWMLTSEAIFGNSMDYLYRPVSYTPSRTAVDSDGRIRLVLTAEDPGYANWIDNQGYTEGVLNFRNIHARTVPELRTTVVERADLAAHLPPDSKRCTPEERTAAMWARFDAIRRRAKV
ncbi:hypothetical protein [Nocardioides sp. TF02-7]|uniref:hypothetical protein n=1 Tax=Nocardioides sp. TF02-7 TaxID=2917724 RepID=UPI001F064330|nr:hypothetical protein [Nocardioides sp. TF02-7]UMG91273.1 hypothetical protein MF408_13955 [Nocardioides sp. TF02-7]